MSLKPDSRALDLMWKFVPFPAVRQHSSELALLADTGQPGFTPQIVNILDNGLSFNAVVFNDITSLQSCRADGGVVFLRYSIVRTIYDI